MGKKGRKNKNLHNIAPATPAPAEKALQKTKSLDEIRAEIYGDLPNDVPDYFTNQGKKAVAPKPAVVDDAPTAYRAYRKPIFEDREDELKNEKVFRETRPKRMEIILHFMNEAVDMLGDKNTPAVWKPKRNKVFEEVLNANGGNELVLYHQKQRMFNSILHDAPETIDAIFESFHFDEEERNEILGEEKEYMMVSASDLLGEIKGRARYGAFGIDGKIADGLDTTYVFLQNARDFHPGRVKNMEVAVQTAKLLEMREMYEKIKETRELARMAYDHVRPADMKVA